MDQPIIRSHGQVQSCPCVSASRRPTASVYGAGLREKECSRSPRPAPGAAVSRSTRPDPEPHRLGCVVLHCVDSVSSGLWRPAGCSGGRRSSGDSWADREAGGTPCSSCLFKDGVPGLGVRERPTRLRLRPSLRGPPGHHLGLLFQAGAGEQPVPAWGERRVEGEGPAAEERRLLGISQGRSGFGRPAAPRVL